MEICRHPIDWIKTKKKTRTIKVKFVVAMKTSRMEECLTTIKDPMMVKVKRRVE